MQIKTRCKAITAINTNLFIFIKVLSNNGGATRDRTADLLNAIQALSQLSYSPNRHDIVHDEFRRCRGTYFVRISLYDIDYRSRFLKR